MGSDRDVLEFIKRYKWTLILGISGLILAICIITYGFFKALLIGVCVAVGIWFGLRLDKNMSQSSSSEDFHHYE